jgi:hypothetical protein
MRRGEQSRSPRRAIRRALINVGFIPRHNYYAVPATPTDNLNKESRAWN